MYYIIFYIIYYIVCLVGGQGAPVTVGVEKRNVITHRVRSKPDSIRQHTSAYVSIRQRMRQ